MVSAVGDAGARPVPAKKRPRVLFVDDEPNVLRALGRLFRSEPWDTAYAASGREALGLFDESPFDVVVTDHRMPGMTGVELLKSVRLRSPSSIRIVLSGYAELSAVIDAVNEGAIFRFVTKPWDDTRLRETLSQAVGGVELRLHNERLQALLRDKTARLAEVNRLTRSASQLSQDANEARIARVVNDALPVGVIASGSDGRVVVANAEACRMLGVSGPAELLGKPMPPTLLQPSPGLVVRARKGVATPWWSGDVFVLWEA
ncbi:MAG: response regulator [Deltaproteobacteria bacterium]|nr:response regulator [Deltaproteobacteria bacterium]